MTSPIFMTPNLPIPPLLSLPWKKHTEARNSLTNKQKMIQSKVLTFRSNGNLMLVKWKVKS